ELAVLDDDVALGSLEQMRGNLLRLGLDLLHRLDDSGAADGDRSRTIGAHAELHLVGVAMHDRDLADGNAETFRDQLCERCLVALAMAVRAGEDFDGADRVDANFRGFPQADAGAETTDRLRRRDAAGLDVAGEADAAELAFGLRLCLAPGKAGIVD